MSCKSLVCSRHAKCVTFHGRPTCICEPEIGSMTHCRSSFLQGYMQYSSLASVSSLGYTRQREWWACSGMQVSVRHCCSSVSSRGWHMICANHRRTGFEWPCNHFCGKRKRDLRLGRCYFQSVVDELWGGYDRWVKSEMGEAHEVVRATLALGWLLCIEDWFLVWICSHVNDNTNTFIIITISIPLSSSLLLLSLLLLSWSPSL